MTGLRAGRWKRPYLKKNAKPTLTLRVSQRGFKRRLVDVRCSARSGLRFSAGIAMCATRIDWCVGNYWHFLGLKPGATKAEIKSAYHRLANLLHRDHGSTDEDMQRLKGNQSKNV